MPNSKIPGLDSLPYLGLITQNLPSLGGVPGLFPGVGRTSELDRAIEQFAGPLTRFATNGQPVASDVNQFLGSIPNLVSNLPGVGNIDLSKVCVHFLIMVVSEALGGYLIATEFAYL